MFVFVRNDMANVAKVCDVKGENVGFRSVMAGQELPKEEAKFVAQKIVNSKAWGQLYKLDGLNKALENKDALVEFRVINLLRVRAREYARGLCSYK